MEYYYVTCGRVYRLPTRTLEVDEAIDRIVTGEDRLRAWGNHKETASRRAA